MARSAPKACRVRSRNESSTSSASSRPASTCESASSREDRSRSSDSCAAALKAKVSATAGIRAKGSSAGAAPASVTAVPPRATVPIAMTVDSLSPSRTTCHGSSSLTTASTRDSATRLTPVRPSMPTVRPAMVRTESPSSGTATRCTVTTRTATAAARFPPLKTTFTRPRRRTGEQRTVAATGTMSAHVPESTRTSTTHAASKSVSSSVSSPCRTRTATQSPANVRNRQSATRRQPCAQASQPPTVGQRGDGGAVVDEQQRGALGCQADDGDEPDEPTQLACHPRTSPSQADVLFVETHEEDIGTFCARSSRRD